MKAILKQIKTEISSIDDSNRKLLQFGYLVGGILILIGIISKGDLIIPLLISIGSILIASALISPALLKRPYIVWMGIATVLGFFVFRVLLVVLYGVAIVPLGFILRLLGKDPLSKGSRKDATTYWHTPGEKSDPEEAF